MYTHFIVKLDHPKDMLAIRSNHFLLHLKDDLTLSPVVRPIIVPFIMYHVCVWHSQECLAGTVDPRTCLQLMRVFLRAAKHFYT